MNIKGGILLRYNGKIKELNHIVISDPSYDKNVNCRYERNNLNLKDWIIDIDIQRVNTPVNEKINLEGTDIFILLHNPKIHCELKNEGSFLYLAKNKILETDIGMDTACVALGINKYAKEINNSIEDWQPDCSLRTLSDGIFGSVKEGKIGKNINFIWISGYLDSDTGYSFEDIIDYLERQLNITELKYNHEKTFSLKQEQLSEKITEVTKSFKELIKEESKILECFKEIGIKKYPISLDEASWYLNLLNKRNELRKQNLLDGEIEKSPFSEAQEKLINEFNKLSKEYKEVEMELNDIQLNDK